MLRARGQQHLTLLSTLIQYTIYLIESQVRFGKVEGENRGPDPKALIDPPIEVCLCLWI